MAIEDMDRKMAERVFGLRLERLKDQIRALPTAEKLLRSRRTSFAATRPEHGST
jgi:hypothetical protein